MKQQQVRLDGSGDGSEMSLSILKRRVMMIAMM